MQIPDSTVGVFKSKGDPTNAHDASPCKEIQL